MNRPFPLRQFFFAALIIFSFCTIALTAAASGVSTLSIERMKSPADVDNALDLLKSIFAEAKEQNPPSFDIQKMIALKSGDCITRLVELSQKADLSQAAQHEEFKKLFLKNAELLRQIIAYNRTRIDDVLEDRFEGNADKSTFYSSSEWQQAQYLLSLASYWQGWNGYYGSLLYTGNASSRTELLEEAASGFTFAVLNIQEQSFVSRSILGRAICFKELKRYDKAQQDLQSVMSRASREDPLYAQAGYERALLSYQTGDKARALQQIQQLEETVKPKAMSPQLKEKLHSLQTNIALGTVEKKTVSPESATKESYQETVRNLKRIAYADESQASVLYQYVLEHAAALANYPDSELGSMGTMAIADWYFDRKQYDRAIERYQRLYSAPDALMRRHMDNVCFRLAYALAQKEKWQDALSCLQTLFAKYPKTSFGGKAACLYYIAAVRAYKANSTDAAYSRYIKAAECYVKNCPDAVDKSEAHYQLGLYYQHKDKTLEALQEFSLVNSDSPHYGEAQKAGVLSLIDKLQPSVDKIETMVRQGQSDETMPLYREILKQAESWQKTAVKKNATAESREADAYLIVLQARLYVHGPEPSPLKALPLLQGFETRYPVSRQRELMYSAVKRLRLECYLQMNHLSDAEHEMNSITDKNPVAKETLAFLNYCADRYYRKSQDSKAKGNEELAAKEAQAALVIYKKLGSLTPNNHDVQIRLAELYIENN